MQNHIRPLSWAVAGLLSMTAVSGWAAPSPVQAAQSAGASADTVAPSIASALGPIPLGTAPNYRAIVAQNHAAVVGITSELDARAASSRSSDSNNQPDDSDESSDRHSRDSSGPHGARPMRALGSGFIISPDGLVLTNAHVVEASTQVTVRLSDHREFVAKVLGADPTTDIAVLKIETHNLPTVRLGNSEQLGVGDYVLAIGAPFGLEETATAGIVSAKARSLPNDASVPFIQTDVAVNPGNSGGPLFDATGAVVGVNSQIYSTSGGYEGVSFAIPINLAERIEEQIVNTGRVVHGRLGVEAQDLDQALAESFDLSSPNGALVSEVLPNSPAASAGLEPGDVILRFDGAMITDAGQLAAQVSMSAPGERATLEVSREGRSLTFAVPIGSATQVAAVERRALTATQTHLGLTLRPLTRDEDRQSGLDGGLLVEDAQGVGAAAGIQEGDVVLSVNGKEVKSIAQLGELVRVRGKRVALLIQRGADRLFVPVATARGSSD